MQPAFGGGAKRVSRGGLATARALQQGVPTGKEGRGDTAVEGLELTTAFPARRRCLEQILTECSRVMVLKCRCF